MAQRRYNGQLLVNLFAFMAARRENALADSLPQGNIAADRPHILYSVATSCLRPIGSPVMKTLRALQSAALSSDVGGANALVMCYDAFSNLTLADTSAKKASSNAPQDPRSPDPGSFAELCGISGLAHEWARPELSALRDNHSPCFLSKLVAPVVVEVVPSPREAMKVFRSSPKEAPTLRASKVRLWKVHLPPERFASHGRDAKSPALSDKTHHSSSAQRATTTATTTVLFAWDDDVSVDPGFDFARYAVWAASLSLGISQPLVSKNGHFPGSGLSLQDWIVEGRSSAAAVRSLEGSEESARSPLSLSSSACAQSNSHSALPPPSSSSSSPPSDGLGAVPWDVAGVTTVEQMAPVYLGQVWASCVWPAISLNDTFHTGWGLEAVHAACACRHHAAQTPPPAQAAGTQAAAAAVPSVMNGSTPPVLSVVAGCGTVAHADAKEASMFSKRRKKGLAERDFYFAAAKAILAAADPGAAALRQQPTSSVQSAESVESVGEVGGKERSSPPPPSSSSSFSSSSSSSSSSSPADPSLRCSARASSTALSTYTVGEKTKEKKTSLLTARKQSRGAAAFGPAPAPLTEHVLLLRRPCD